MRDRREAGERAMGRDAIDRDERYERPKRDRGETDERQARYR